MIAPPVRHVRTEPAPARHVLIEIRQRRTALVLTAASLTAAVGASISGAGGLWLTTGAGATVLAGYLVLVARVRRLTAQREMSAAFAVDASFDWDAFGRSLSDARLVVDEGAILTGPAPTVSMANRDLVRFVAAWVSVWR